MREVVDEYICALLLFLSPYHLLCVLHSFVGIALMAPPLLWAPPNTGDTAGTRLARSLPLLPRPPGSALDSIWSQV